MGERTIERDEVVVDEHDQALRQAVDRADKAEAELAKLKKQAQAAKHTEGTTDRDESKAGAGGHASSGRGTRKHADEHLIEPGSLDRSKQPAAQSPEGHAVGEPESHGLDALREDSMMAHLLDSLEQGQDIGHYGRLVFAMIARHFLTDDEVMAELTKDRDFSEDEARQMLVQVEGRDYSPPRRDRILQWQQEQEFPIIPNASDPDCGNVYKSLRFPKETYSHIGHYQEEKAAS